MRRFTKYEALLVILFLLTLPLSNPWVRGDGVGYYAFARSMLIEHRLDFTKDWLAANTSFRMDRTDAHGNIAPSEYTATGHLDNHFSVGPAILMVPISDGGAWERAPVRPARWAGSGRRFLEAVPSGDGLGNGAVRVFRAADFLSAGAKICSRAMGVSCHSGHLVCEFACRCTCTSIRHGRTRNRLSRWRCSSGIGFARVRRDVGAMDRSRGDRRADDGRLLRERRLAAAPVARVARRLLESVARNVAEESIVRLFLKNVVFVTTLFAAFVPTLVSKKIIYGSYLNFGYRERWFWRSPAFFKVCFSADHGLFSWTPILILAVTGLFILRRRERTLAWYLSPCLRHICTRSAAIKTGTGFLLSATDSSFR